MTKERRFYVAIQPRHKGIYKALRIAAAKSDMSIGKYVLNLIVKDHTFLEAYEDSK